MPHTHLRGTRWQYKLEKPDSTSEVILDVPHYDFNWQTYYMFAKPLEIPAGRKIMSMAWYDNSASNKSNPDATKDVKWGDQTWEEMQYTGFPLQRAEPAISSRRRAKRVSAAPVVILRSEATKDRFPSRQFNSLGAKAILRRFAPQDDDRCRFAPQDDDRCTLRSSG